MTYEDLVLHIGEWCGDGYRIRVLGFPSEVAQGYWRLPESRELLSQRLADLVQAVAGGNGRGSNVQAFRHVDPAPLVALPRRAPREVVEELVPRLFGGLWEGAVGDLLRAHFGPHRTTGLRLRIHLDPDHPHLPWLASLPWELFGDPCSGTPLATNPKTPVVRQVGTASSRAPVEPITGPLRILLASAGPSSLPPLSLEHERRLIEQAWARHAAVEISTVTATSLGMLREALVGRTCHILHWMGHGEVDESVQEGVLAFVGDDGEDQKVSGRDLALKLQGLLPGLRLVLLSACETARAPVLQPFASVAARLIRVGVPAVVAMQFPVSDRASTAFSTGFHRRIAAGDLLEEAVAEGRQAVHSLEPDSFEWATPVLFLSREGERFAVAPPVGGPYRKELLDRYLEWELDRNREVELPLAPEGLPTTLPLEVIHAEICPLDEEQDGTYRTLEDLMCSERAVLLSGEAGSGKTTLLRWLTARLARAWRAGHDRLIVAAAELEPEGRGELDLGPVRMPILVRLAAFATARRGEPDLGLAAYLGRHLGDGPSPPTTALGEPLLAEPLGSALRDLLATGEAVLLLDGLDEVTDLAERNDVVREIRRFLVASERIAGEGGAASPRNEELQGSPSGLQAMVTTRPGTGSESALGGGFRRYTLLALSRASAVRLAEAMERALGSEEAHTAVAGIAEAVDRSKGASAAPGGEELTTTPWGVALLMTISAERGGKMAFEPRAHLSDRLLSGWIRRWRGRNAAKVKAGVGEQEVLDLLARLAAEARDSDGEADQAVGGVWLRNSEERHRACRVGREVGLLSLDGGHFLYPELEEQLAARALVSEPCATAERLQSRLGEPRWGEPILLALELLSHEDETALVEFASALVAVPAPPASIAPRGGLALVAALPRLADLPSELAKRVAEGLLSAWSDPTVSGPSRRRLELAFRQLYASRFPVAAKEADGALKRALGSGEEERVGAATVLLERLDRWNVDLAAALAAAEPFDSAIWDWPVSRALRHLAATEPELLPRLPGSVRHLLPRRPELLRRFTTKGDWPLLALGLLGLVEDSGSSGARGKHAYRESPLAPLLLTALEAGRSPRALIPELRRLAGDPSVDRRLRADARMALVLQGDPGAHCDGNDPAASLARTHLLSLGRWLEEQAPATARAALEHIIARGQSRLPGDREEDFRACIRAVLAAADGSLGASRLAQLAAAAPVHVRPWLLAEMWRSLVAIPDPHGLYTACVLLDTAGRTLTDPPEMLLDSLALVGQGMREEKIEGRVPTRAGQSAMASALDALTAMPEPYDFVRGWALERLTPSLVDTGWSAEALVLALGSLSDRFQTRSRAVCRLLAVGKRTGDRTLRPPAELWLEHPEPAAALFRLSFTVSDPYLRRRCQLQLGHWFPRFHEDLPPVGSGDYENTAEALAAPGPLADPSSLLRALLPAGIAAVLELKLRFDRWSPRLLREQSGEEAPVLLRNPICALDGEIVFSSVEQLKGTDDRLRFRAALDLHGDRSRSMDLLATHRLAPGTMEALARGWRETRFDQPAAAKALEWTFERLHHTDGGALRVWQRTLEQEGPGASEAEVILSRVESLSSAVWPTFLEALESVSGAVRRALLSSLCRLAARERLPQERLEQVVESLRRSSFEAPAAERFLLTGPEGLVEAAEEATSKMSRASDGGLPGEPWVHLAEGAVARRAVSWSRLLSVAPEELGRHLAAVGSLGIASRSYEHQVRRAAKRACSSPALLTALIGWLEDRLRRSPLEAGLEPWLTGDLLAVTAEAGWRSPAAFKAAVKLVPRLEKLLSEAAQAHETFTGRRAALVLLGQLGRVTPRVLTALRRAIQDVPEVQAAAMDMAGQLRWMEDDNDLDIFEEELRQESAAAAWAAARVLQRIALNPRLSSESRRRSLEILAAAARDPRVERELLSLTAEKEAFGQSIYRIRSHGSLAGHFRDLLAEARGDWLFAPLPALERLTEGQW